MTAHRASILIAGVAVAGLGWFATPASAQVDDAIVLSIMRECAKIGDPTARLACYDNNIRSAGGNPSSVPGQMPAPRGGAAPVAADQPQGFGAENIQTPQERVRTSRPSGEIDEINVRVASARERQPGVWLVELENGNQWLFNESVPNTYRAPRRGDTVKIERGALGSYLMRVNNQSVVQVRRVR